MNLSTKITLPLVFAGSLVAQVANDVGFTRGWGTTYTDRAGANNITADCLNHYDSRDYLDWMLDPADATGATFKFTGVRFVIQDQIGNTTETYRVVAYNEDPVTQDFPDATAPWVATGAFNMPASTATTAVAWIITVTMPATTPSVPKGDKWIGVGLVPPLTGTWPTDGASLHCAFDRANPSTSTAASDLAGLGISTMSNSQVACNLPVVAGVPTGPAVYPAATAGNRREIRLEVIANVTGGVCVTQTNQTTYTVSNPGVVAGATPLGGTTNFFSGLYPDTYNGTASATPRADDIGFLVADSNFPNSPVFVILAFGPSPLGSVPLSLLSPAVAAPGTRGNVCVDFTTGVTFFGLSNSTGQYQQMLTLNAGARSVIQGLTSPTQTFDFWYQGFVMNVGAAGPALEVHATGCGVQHL